MLLTPPPVVVVGGKGGVGKTSVASAMALASADAGRRTLLLSTDPAHSLSDVLDVRLGDRPHEVTERLWALEPDAARTAAARIRQVERDAAAALPREILPAVRTHLQRALDGPGTREAALADRLVEALGELGGRWDTIVVDSAPTGHLLQLVAAPAAMADWVASLAERRRLARPADPAADAVGREPPEDVLLRRLRERQARTAAAATRLREDAWVQLVCIPRRVVVAETVRAADALRAAGLPLGPTVFNHPDGHVDDEVVTRARRRLAPVFDAPRWPTEPIGVDQLRRWWAAAG